jgi:plasmid stability protein
MSHLVLNDLDPELIEELQRRADRHGRALEAEVKAVLNEALGLGHSRALAAARRVRVTLEGAPSNAALLAALRGQ